MKKNLLILICLTFSYLPMAGQNKKYGEIDSIKVVYINKYVKSFTFNITCESFSVKKGDIETLITDKKILSAIQNRLDQLRIDKKNKHINDARLSSTIYFKDGTTSQLCLLLPHAVQIYMDNNNYCYDGNLLYLLKKHSDYYSWMPREIINDMPEINDKKIKKEPILITRENNPKVKD